MAGITGAENVKRFISNADKKHMKIWDKSEGMRGAPCFTSDSPEEGIDEFVNLFGESTEEYILVLHDYEPENEVDAITGKKKKGGDYVSKRVKTTFSLNPKPAKQAYVNQAQQPGNYSAEERLATIIKLMQPQQQQNNQAEMFALITGVKDNAHKAQLEMMNTQIAWMNKNFSQQLANMQERMEEMMEDEEDARTEEAAIKGRIEEKKVEMQGYKELANIGAQVLGEVKNVVYELTGRTTSQRVAGAPLLKAAGPALSQQAVPTFNPTISDKPGEMKLYLEPRNDEDQQNKIQTYATKLWHEADQHLGDDLILLYKMKTEMPAKFEEVIGKLRETFGY